MSYSSPHKWQYGFHTPITSTAINSSPSMLDTADMTASQHSLLSSSSIYPNINLSFGKLIVWTEVTSFGYSE